MDEPTKRCARCGEEKPHSAFYWHKRTTYTLNGAIEHRPGPLYICKLCDHIAREANKKKQRAAFRLANQYRAAWARGKDSRTVSLRY